jgi:hypothetical protein
MRTKKTITLLLIVLVLAALGYFGPDVYFRMMNPRGYQNQKICKDIPVGVQFPDLVKILGEPINSWEIKGQKWYSFNTSSIAAGLIKARVKGTQVLELRCSEDGPSTWKINDGS